MIKFIIFLSIYFGAFALFFPQSTTVNNPPDVPRLITMHGYPVQIHEITTQDGYILTVHRIPYGTNKTANCTNREVVLLLHGLFCSSAEWVTLGPNNALAFLLADTCYDVWMINFRGNDQSQKHSTLDPITNLKYWDFGWHEMGVYDVSATINFILLKTGKSNLTLVGHSQGCTAAFIAAISHSYLVNVIKVIIALAPAVYLGNMEKQGLRYMAQTEPAIRALAMATGYQKCSINDGFMKDAAATYCTNISPAICTMCLAYGFDLSGTNDTALLGASGYTPSAVCCKQLIHFFQLINCGCFRQYDYDPVKNYLLYGSLTPPLYDLSKVTIPVCIFYAAKDQMVVPVDVRKLASELPNCVALNLIEGNFSHLDFVYGNYATDLVYLPMMKICL